MQDIKLDIPSPDVKMPDVKMPDVDIPKVSVPTVSVPTVSVPGIDFEGLKNIAPTVKIIFGWGQILSSFNLTFKIDWPNEFDSLMNAMYAPFNIDLFSLFKDFGCRVNSSYPAAFRMHMLMIPMLLSLIFAAWLTAQIYKKVMCCKLCKPHYDNKTLYARVLKLANLLIFCLYPGIGLRIFRVFALSCYNPKLKDDVDPMDPLLEDSKKYQDICEEGGRYMTSDLSVRETDPEYLEMRGWAWFWMFLYVFGIPALYITVLYTKRKIIAKDPDDEGQTVHPDDHQEVMKCRTEFGSMYKDYKRKYYWFELVEMVRKILLVGALVMLGSSGMQIFAGIIICFFYVLLVAYLEPLTSRTDQVLQYVTSIQLFCTLISGLMINYRSFERDNGKGNEMQDLALSIWLMFSTVIVFVVIVTVLASMCMLVKKMKKAKDDAKASAIAAKEAEEEEKEKKGRELEEKEKAKTATL